MRLIVARCEVSYQGRAAAFLPEAVRLVMLKGDGTVMIWDDGGSYKVKPLNWMTAPTFLADEGDRLVVTKPKSDDAHEIRLLEVLSDVEHDMGESAALQKDGVERDLQEALAAAPEALGEALTLVRREWQTEIGPVGQRELEVALDAVLLERGRLAHLVLDVGEHLVQPDLEPVLALELAHDDQVLGLLDHRRRRHPVERLVAAGVGVHEDGAVRLEHHEPQRLRQPRRQAPGVLDGTAGHDQSHERRTVIRPPDRTSRVLKGR